MNYETVIKKVKQEIKKHLDDGYNYEMLVNLELDVIDWNSLLDYISDLKSKNQKLQKMFENMIQLSEIGTHSYYNGASRTALFEVISSIEDILKEAKSK